MDIANHWEEKIAKLMGVEVQIETLDGIYLTGKLTKVEVKTVIIDECEVPLPIALGLDNDQEKVIDIPRLKSIVMR